MNKKIFSKIFFIILILLIIFVTAFAIFNSKKDLCKKMYKDICEKSLYTFSMEEISSQIKYKLTISKKENSICIDSLSQDDHTSTLVNEQESYYINHNSKEYFLYNISKIDADILRNDLNEVENKKYTTGHEKIEDKKYYYEEYEGIGAFILQSDYSIEENLLRTRFYFDKNKIVYIKTIIENVGEELIKINFSENIDENLFQIPDDYAEM